MKIRHIVEGTGQNIISTPTRSPAASGVVMRLGVEIGYAQVSNMIAAAKRTEVYR
jgi:hypothetical protein